MAKRNLEPKDLQRIAAGLVQKSECQQLAAELDLSMDDYHRFFASKEPVDLLAPRVLLKWVEIKGGRATGPCLHAALVNIRRKDLADSFADILLAEEGKVVGNVID